MDRDDDGETSYKYNTFVDNVAFEPTYLQALPTAAGRNVATLGLLLIEANMLTTTLDRHLDIVIGGRKGIRPVKSSIPLIPTVLFRDMA